MAVSDLFVGVVMVILKSMNPYMQTSLADNVAAQTAYHVMKFCMVRFTLLVSVFNLVALTIDRLYAIRFPFAAQRMERRFHIKVCCGIWFVSLVITSIFYMLITYSLKDSLRYKDAIFPIATIPATVLFFVSYTMIFTVVRRTSNTVKTMKISVRSKNGTNKELQQSTQRSREEKEKRAFIRLAVKTVAVFVICWLPLSIISIYKLVSTEAPHPNLESTAFTLALFNSLIDPYVYFTHFQRAIRKLFGCCIRNRTDPFLIQASSSSSNSTKV
uniref:G-protein coupled receptors family 1 profile domain-containing protein n=1 Tax=Clytia hemisphaerica TaxID=252671 RepID=A0A7M5WWB5_9CNID